MMATAIRPHANQPPPLAGYNLFEQDAALVEGIQREGGGPWEAQIAAFGETLGGSPLEWGRLANGHPPVLRTHDRYGERIDEVEFHPAWDRCCGSGSGAGCSRCRGRTSRAGAHVRAAALFICSARSRPGSAARCR